ncbi:uncharacterized protein PHACADRAFT_120913 [Phanerochaete carnosa HHB-10118-sp]|uniref:N-acetyltransferase ECO1 n=1 Tax=Phanerochaete carnosa (strain HHB-10118-sp) TaxID=650164 RepID=K5W919_PHACS|nr:uncharacterized protein PHACADRAFT_120913 [Phanerochaete carnosa HHB-10118-sp]EKM55464.1 hypothetical protein PHACADRAFT_120913 [Phanerochaete carnosa HHB-10118-sp]
MSSRAKRTYGSRPAKPALPPSSPPLTLSSPPRKTAFNNDTDHDDDGRSASPSLKRKRTSLEDLSINAPQARKPVVPAESASKTLAGSLFTRTHDTIPKRKGKAKRSAKGPEKPRQKHLTQLHFALDTTVLRTCSLCSLTYTRGAPDDESLHRAHCARVQKGMEWGKEEEREAKNGKAQVEEVAGDVKLKNGTKGRIVCFRADVGGKIGSKLSTLLDTVNIILSAPAMTAQSLQASKAYLFLLSSPPITSSSISAHREKIVGCVIAQRISSAMAIASRDSSNVSSEAETTKDSSSAIRLLPTPLSTPLGIPRLFVSSSHRRQGVASSLLTAAANYFILGCPLDPKKGEVAFSQPTGLGGMVLEKWAGGKGRVFEE